MKSKLIVALDVDNYEHAAGLVTGLGDVAGIFKVGNQLFTRVGPRIVDFINAQGKRCFLDLKFHDIPNAVAKSVESAVGLHVHMLTLHVTGGEEMLRTAAAIPGRPLLLGVTVLTSIAGDMKDEVLLRARQAQDCGLDGVIASPHEVKALRAEVGEKFLIVTPGIRPAGSHTGDQKRTMTPAEAVAAGANYIVVGRPILAAKDPAQAALRIIDELASAVKST